MAVAIATALVAAWVIVTLRRGGRLPGHELPPPRPWSRTISAGDLYGAATRRKEHDE